MQKTVRMLFRNAIIGLLFLQLFFSLNITGQTSAFYKPDWQVVESEFYKLINELRAKYKAPALSPDPILKLAANDQAHYMDSLNMLSHSQKYKQKQTPRLRILYYKGNSDFTGENCSMIYLNIPMKVKYSNKLHIVKTEKEIADAIFIQWKNSPDHYRNMINPEYMVSGLGFSFDALSNQLYSTQVYSSKLTEKRK